MLPMKSWKTTATSAISAVSAFVLFASQAHMVVFPGWITSLAVFTMAGGLASFGVVAKDKNVTGGDVGQPSTPQALTDANQAHSAVNPPALPPVA